MLIVERSKTMCAARSSVEPAKPPTSEHAVHRDRSTLPVAPRRAMHTAAGRRAQLGALTSRGIAALRAVVADARFSFERGPAADRAGILAGREGDCRGGDR